MGLSRPPANPHTLDAAPPPPCSRPARAPPLPPAAPPTPAAAPTRLSPRTARAPPLALAARRLLVPPHARRARTSRLTRDGSARLSARRDRRVRGFLRQFARQLQLRRRGSRARFVVAHGNSRQGGERSATSHQPSARSEMSDGGGIASL